MAKQKKDEEVEFVDLYGKAMQASELAVARHYLHNPGGDIGGTQIQPRHFVLMNGVAALWQRATALELEGTSYDLASLVDESDASAVEARDSIIRSTEDEETRLDIEGHERRLVEAAVLRTTAHELQAIADEIYKQRSSVDQAIHRVAQVLEAMRNDAVDLEVPICADVVVANAHETAEVIQLGVPTGLEMPIDIMNERLSGWRPGRSHVVCAITAGHKTTLLRQSAYHLAMKGIATDFIAYEDDAWDLAARCMSAEPSCDLTWRAIVTGEVDKSRIGEFIRAVGIMESTRYPIGILDKSPDIDKLVSFMYQRVRTHNVKAFFIDYLQIIPYFNPRMNLSERTEYKAERLRIAAKELGAALILGVQPTNAATADALRTNKIIDVADFKNSSGIAQNCFGALCLHFPMEEIKDKGADGRTTIRFERKPNKLMIVPRKWKYSEPNQPMFCNLDAPHDMILDQRR